MDTKNKEIIISLIQQDLKHNQLTTGLKNIGLDPGIHSLEIIKIVARLMGIEINNISDQWIETYLNFIEKAHLYKISDLAEELLPLAEECYILLLSCQNIEKQISDQ